MADVWSEREGVAEPWDIIEDAFFLVLVLFLFLLVVFILIHGLSYIHMAFQREPTFSKYLKRTSEANHGGAIIINSP